MKKVIKSRIFLIIVLCIISCGIGVYAANTYNASDVLYTTSDGTSMTVNDALNDLYVNSKKEYYVNGLVAYYNPVSGEKCKVSEAVSTTGTKTGCMKWYIYKDDGKNYTMILDHNTTAGIAWNTDGINVSYEESNIKPEVDKLVSVSKWVDTPRLISAEEIPLITGYTSFDSTNTNVEITYDLDSNSKILTMRDQGENKYAWLFDYTYRSTIFGGNTADDTKYTNGYISGYWTSTTWGTAGSGRSVLCVNMGGCLSHALASDTTYGVRPVITIPKSKLF